MSSLTSLLTARQSEILEFIRHSLMEAGAPPTREEISRAFGFRSLNAAEQHLQALQKKGLIELVSGTSRGIRLKETLLELKQTSADILEGDWLAVHKKAEAVNGQIVVARLGDEVTVKRLRQKGSRAELIAENPEFKPIVVDLKREPLQIEGIAVGVIRPAL